MQRKVLKSIRKSLLTKNILHRIMSQYLYSLGQRNYLYILGPERIKNICERKRQEIGGENIKKLESAREQRRKQDEYYERLNNRNFERFLENKETKLLGGNSDEE